MLKRLVRKMVKLKDKITMAITAKIKFKAVKQDLDCKQPMQVINADGYVFHVKDVDAIIHSNDNMAVSEIAAIYQTSIDNLYVIAVDKTFMKLSKRTKSFVLSHEIAHVVYGLHNPSNKLAIEIKADKAAGLLMQLNSKAIRNCLREIRHKCKYYSSYEILTKRIKNIK